jgi:hypothetical protein
VMYEMNGLGPRKTIFYCYSHKETSPYGLLKERIRYL